MPRYLVERSIPHASELTAEELKAIAQQSLRVQHELEAEIHWIVSTFTDDGMVCLYIADDETILEEHARLSGLPIRRINRVSAIISPMMDALD
jgi:hypothetical protein